MIVMLMSEGHSPTEACERTLRHMCAKWKGEKMFEVGLIALNNKVNMSVPLGHQFRKLKYCLLGFCHEIHKFPIEYTAV